MESPIISRLSRSLHQAVRARRVALVKSLLWLGVNVNAKDCQKQTALHLACDIQDEFEDMERVVELLLKSGAEVNVQDEEGSTPLHVACFRGNHRCVQALLKHGAKISVIDFKGQTPLHYSVIHFNRCNAIQTVKTLMAINTPDCSMESRHLQSAHNNEDEDILAVLNLQDNDGSTALHMAAMQKGKELVSLLLWKGAKVGIKDNQGKTALHCAAEARAVEVVDVLMDYEAYVNAKDSSGNTPLHLACSFVSYFDFVFFDESTIEKLLCRGANASEKNVRQKTPIEELHEHSLPFSPYNCRNVSVALMDDKDGRLNLPIEKTFIKHVIKKREFETHAEFDMKWKSDPAVCDEIKNECSEEIEDMKCTRIVKDITLYQVLSHTNQPYLLLPDELLLIDDYLKSPDVMRRFPLYGNSLKITFQRSKLLTLAVQSFYSDRRKLMWKKLPYEMTEHLVTFLSNADLRNFLKSE